MIDRGKGNGNGKKYLQTHTTDDIRRGQRTRVHIRKKRRSLEGSEASRKKQ